MARVLLLCVLISLGIAALVFGQEAREAGGWIARASTSLESSKSSYRYATVDRGEVMSSVAATGNLAPVALVLVSTQISGQIKELYADFNSEVSRGDPIALINPLLFEIAVEQAEAELGIAQANLLKALVTLREAEAELERKESLQSRGAGSVVDRGKAEATRDLARAQVQDATSTIKRAEAALKKASADLEQTVIRAPVDGVVIHRTIEAGQIVAASLQAPTLFTIAQDLRDMQLNASIDESEIGRIFPGQAVEFTVDAHPGRRFSGKVAQIRKSGQSSQNVVTYMVVVRAPNPDLLLLPGMTASSRFIVAKRENVLQVPNAALRFNPLGTSAGGQNRVWIDDGGTLRPLPVKVGVANDQRSEISGEGLEVGVRVVVGREAVKKSSSSAKRLIGIF